MKDDTDNLIIELCNQIGMAMEDASVTALQIRKAKPGDRVTVVADLEIAATRITALTAAAKVLLV